MTRKGPSCVPELFAKSPLAGTAPVTLQGLRMQELALGQITSIAVFPGQGKAIAKALKPLGLNFPGPNQTSQSGAARLVWTGRDQAFLFGAAAPEGLARHAALTDQSDGWAGLRLEGPLADLALMRHYPLDLRQAAFAVGMTRRSALNHMPSILIRSGPYAFDIMVFRSMARTAWHEVEAAMTALAARKRVSP